MFAAARGSDAYTAHQNVQAPFVDAWAQANREAATGAFLRMWGDGEAWNDIPTRRQDALVAQIHLIPAAAPAIDDDVHGILSRLGSVTCLIDVILGSQSLAVMPAVAQGLAARLPQAKCHVVKGAGHMVALSHPDEVTALL